MTNASSTNSHQAADTWEEIESLVEELTELSKSTLAAADFHAQLLDRSVRALGSVAGAIWIADRSGGLGLGAQVNLGEVGLAQNSKLQHSHASLIAKSRDFDQPQAIAPRSSSTVRQDNPTDFLLVLCPLALDGEFFGVIELFHAPDVSPRTQRGYLEVAAVISELAADFHRNRLLRELRDRESSWSRFDRFAAEIHASLELRATAYAIANEARSLLDCDRVSVVLRRGRNCRVHAVSGMDVIDRRATAIRQLQAAIAAVLAKGEPFWHTARDDMDGSELDGRIRDYLSESAPQTLIVLPLHFPTTQTDSSEKFDTFGALVIERFGSDRSEPISEQRLASVKRHSEAALHNSLTLRNLPLVSLSRFLAKLWSLTRLRRLPITLTVLAILVVAITCLCVIPADFNITARGQLNPVEVHHIYAPEDGVVADVGVDESQEGGAVRVTAKQELIQLESLALQAKWTDVNGALATAEAEQFQLEEKIRRVGRTPDNETEYDNWELQLAVLPKKIESLKAQLKILDEQKETLLLASPIDGEVLTWNVAKELQGRAVLHGQKLLTVAKTDGAWVLELAVPDSDIGHVLTARDEIKPNLEVTFILKSDPGAEFSGSVKNIARATNVDEADGATVLVTVEVDREKLPRIRPGTVVVAKIHCGEVALGYVWLHDLIDAVKTKILF